jgi:DNA-nicking Smr family endonuclease
MPRSRNSASPDEDVALFRDAVRDATPLPAPQRVTKTAPPPPAVPVQSLLDEHEALAQAREAAFLSEAVIDGLDEASFARPGIGRDVLRKLRRGHWVVQSELDLHGATRESARVMVAEFLAQTCRRGARCVRIIHGKGRGSPGREPVLRGLVRKWLTRDNSVVAYCEAPATQGGAGAVLVLLR